nr:unnamed protein product [Digitaria exilis]
MVPALSANSIGVDTVVVEAHPLELNLDRTFCRGLGAGCVGEALTLALAEAALWGGRHCFSVGRDRRGQRGRRDRWMRESRRGGRCCHRVEETLGRRWSPLGIAVRVGVGVVTGRRVEQARREGGVLGVCIEKRRGGNVGLAPSWGVTVRVEDLFGLLHTQRAEGVVVVVGRGGGPWIPNSAMWLGRQKSPLHLG